jgi:hypothetical protein
VVVFGVVMRSRGALAALGAAVLVVIPATGVADARAAGAPTLSAVRCVPATTQACRSGVRVTVGRRVQLRGRNLSRRLRASFRWPGGALAAKLSHGRAGYLATVPTGTRPGRVTVTLRDRAGRRSRPRTITVLRQRGLSRVPERVGPGQLPAAFRGHGMWIWQLPKTEGGDLDAIATRARAAGMATVFVKSSDGATVWSQFSPQMVQTLKARGLRVCAWQFVYGANPLAEARAGQAAVQRGADCLVIDAESAYDGRYAAAQRYLEALRAAVGRDYPLGLTSFPYIDYHPRFPYSVFLAPGGAQANLPQIYWKDIGARVDAASARTFAHNRIYGAPLAPLGQAYGGPPPADLQRFRALWAGYGAGGVSWWSWQSANATTFATLGRPAPAAEVPADPGWPVLERGSKGDEVIWLQQHLASATPGLSVDGAFSAGTAAALRALQASRGLPPSGVTDPATWRAVLDLPVTPVDWAAR